MRVKSSCSFLSVLELSVEKMTDGISVLISPDDQHSPLLPNHFPDITEMAQICRCTTTPNRHGWQDILRRKYLELYFHIQQFNLQNFIGHKTVM